MDGLTMLTEIRKIDRSGARHPDDGPGKRGDPALGAARGSHQFLQETVQQPGADGRDRMDRGLSPGSRAVRPVSPLPTTEDKILRPPPGVSSYYPVVNQITLQLPCLVPAEGDPEPQDRHRGDDHQRHRARQPRHQLRGKEPRNPGGELARADAGRAPRRRGAPGGGSSSPHVSPPRVFEVTIRDEGKGFDWRALPAVVPENLLAFNGRGIFLTKIYFDDVEYNEAGNQVTLRKRAAPGAAELR